MFAEAMVNFLIKFHRQQRAKLTIGDTLTPDPSNRCEQSADG